MYRVNEGLRSAGVMRVFRQLAGIAVVVLAVLVIACGLSFWRSFGVGVRAGRNWDLFFGSGYVGVDSIATREIDEQIALGFPAPTYLSWGKPFDPVRYSRVFRPPSFTCRSWLGVIYIQNNDRPGSRYIVFVHGGYLGVGLTAGAFCFFRLQRRVPRGVFPVVVKGMSGGAEA